MEKKIRVLVKAPGCRAKSALIANELKTMQDIVGGYIEAVPLAADAAIVCNEEGRLLRLPYNCMICGMEFYGTVILAGVDRDEFCDVPDGLKCLGGAFRDVL